MACPSIPAVLIVHSRTDERFPDFGRGAAAPQPIGDGARRAGKILTLLPMAAMNSRDVPEDGA